MIKLTQANLFQWDTGRQVQVTPPTGFSISQVHFANSDADTDAYEVNPGSDGLVNIPDECLQSPKDLYIYSVYVNEDTQMQTVEKKIIPIIQRACPSGYIYVPTEKLNYEKLDAAKVDKNQGVANSGKLLQVSDSGILTLKSLTEIINENHIDLNYVDQTSGDTLVLDSGNSTL